MAAMDADTRAKLQLTLGTIAGTVRRAWRREDFVHDELVFMEPGEADDQSIEVDSPDEDLFDLLDDNEDTNEHMAAEDGAAVDDDAVDAELEQAFTLVTLEWAGDLRRATGTPFAHVETMRDELVDYLMSLPPDEGRLARLLPTRASFEQRLVNVMSYERGEYYRGAMLFALMPSFIDMLSARGLVKRDRAKRTKGEIQRLRDHVLRVISEANVDGELIGVVRASAAM
ncbi:MAG: hypothetical protein U0531_01275 [Dehalococcoidia bacterium]